MVRYAPQQNIVAERLNRTIMDRVKSQMSNDLISKRFWTETVSYTVYILNRCPRHSTNFITLEEKWSNHPSKVDNLKIFGCVGYVHQNLKKLRPRQTKCMFIGFTKGYQMWHPTHRRCIISRDVRIKEDEMFMMSKNNVKKGLVLK